MAKTLPLRNIFCNFARHFKENDNSTGEMLEWLMRHAWKACVPLKGTAGSNPAFSAVSTINRTINKMET